MKNSKKIVWAFDPMDTDENIQKRTNEFLSLFSDLEQVEIYPVHVLRSDFYLTSEYFAPIDPLPLEANMKKECKTFLQNFSALPLRPLKVLTNHFSSRGAEVRMLTDFVEKTDPDFVLLGTHGHEGWARAMIGSFAETFLSQSKVPTVIIGPKTKKITSLRSGLLPIHLGQSSQNFVESFLDDHRLSFINNLNLFHQISMMDIENIAWAPEVYALKDYGSNDLIATAKAETKKYLESFLDHPLAQKRLSYSISDQVSSVHEAIVSQASKESYDIIVMKSESNVFEANILGSVTRNVIRAAQCPVVVYPHKFQK